MLRFRIAGLHTLSKIILVTLSVALQSPYNNAKGMISCSGLMSFQIVASLQTGGYVQRKALEGRAVCVCEQ